MRRGCVCAGPNPTTQNSPRWIDSCGRKLAMASPPVPFPDVSLLMYAPPRQMPGMTGMRTSYLSFRNGAQKMVQIPPGSDIGSLCSMPFPLSNFGDEQSDRRSLTLSVVSTPALDFLRLLDKRNVEAAKENRDTWFPGRTLSDEDVEKMYTPVLIEDPDGKYPPRLRCKVYVGDASSTSESGTKKTREVQVQVVKYDAQGKKVIDHYQHGGATKLVEGSQCIAILELSSIWLQKTRFGMTLRVASVVTKPPEASILECDWGSTPAPRVAYIGGVPVEDLSGAPPGEEAPPSPASPPAKRPRLAAPLLKDCTLPMNEVLGTS